MQQNQKHKNQNKIGHAISEIHTMAELANRDQWVNHVHPLVKLCVTIGYILCVVSFSKYDILGLLSMVIYLWVGYQVADLSFKDAFRRLRLIIPIVCVVGIINPFLDTTYISIGSVMIRGGWISMVTLILKGIFAVLATYLLVGTTSIEAICYGLRSIHVPGIIVTEILLIYRYITVLLTEVKRITDAYSLRAPNQKGIHISAWGSLAGQLLLRSIDRANDVYESMILRGYTGEYGYLKSRYHWNMSSVLYLVLWLLFFYVCHRVQVILLIGQLVGGLFL